MGCRLCVFGSRGLFWGLGTLVRADKSDLAKEAAQLAKRMHLPEVGEAHVVPLPALCPLPPPSKNGY